MDFQRQNQRLHELVFLRVPQLRLDELVSAETGPVADKIAVDKIEHALADDEYPVPVVEMTGNVLAFGAGNLDKLKTAIQ